MINKFKIFTKQEVRVVQHKVMAIKNRTSTIYYEGKFMQPMYVKTQSREFRKQHRFNKANWNGITITPNI